VTVPRIRTIKPEFFFDEEIAALPHQTRLFFVGLWTHADRRGRLEDRPHKLKAQILPYENADADAMLSSLHPKFIVRYEVSGHKYLWIRKFEDHQRPHHTEAESCIPEYKGENTVSSRLRDRENPLGRERKGRERKGKELLSGSDPTSPLNGLIPETIAYLNAKLKTAYRPTTKTTVRHLHARIEEGYGLAELKAVIDYKVKQWGNDPQMREYLRPATLFGTKFESYLQAAQQEETPDAAPHFGPHWPKGGADAQP
jgi:uncharacterized phage protein (TIGR02220 family)